MKHLIPLMLVTLFQLGYNLNADAQTPFSTYDSININNINARQLVHGDMWFYPDSVAAKCEFPKGSGKHISNAAALWLSGYDAGNQLHIAAQTYRQNGNDFWPGPLDANDTLTYATSQNWSRIWKVNASDISAFNAILTHTTANTPQAILEWPAKGNPFAKGNNNVPLTISQGMAPFIDVNSDGVYNPLQGDYPAIKGDQALWLVYSDNGPTHTETNGQTLKVEIHEMVFAYNRGTLIDNVVYYEYSIYNRSNTNYTNFRVGEWADMDLGWAFDDYVGFDSSLRMGIVYNSKSPDGIPGTAGQYGYSIPVAGITMVVLPGDAGTNYVPAGDFTYYNNDGTQIGNPITAAQYNYYMRASWFDSFPSNNPFKFGLHCPGHIIDSNEKYLYPGDPSDTSQWSECACRNQPGDRRFIITSNDFTLNPGSSQKVVMALVTTNPMPNNACPHTSFDSIKVVADTAWHNYFNPPPASVNNITSAAKALLIYPNPAHDILFIETPVKNTANENIRIYNALGQIINIPIIKNAGKTEIGINSLPSGVYNILYSNNEIQKNVSFIKY